MGQTSFPYTTYLSVGGVPIANGFLLIRLSTDCTDGAEQITARTTRVELDESGTIIGDPQFYSNDSLTPGNSYYSLDAYAANGQRVLGPVALTIIGIIPEG